MKYFKMIILNNYHMGFVGVDGIYLSRAFSQAGEIGILRCSKSAPFSSSICKGRSQYLFDNVLQDWSETTTCSLQETTNTTSVLSGTLTG